MQNTLFVIDNKQSLQDIAEFNTISFEDYLRDYPKLNEPKIRIINLCNIERYLSQGYYCSLLAEARYHEVLPSSKVINALRNGVTLWFDKKAEHAELDKLDFQHEFVVCMGESEIPQLEKFASKAFRSYPSPLLSMRIEKESKGWRITLKRCNLFELNTESQTFCMNVLGLYASKLWKKRNSGSGKKHRWEIAMLINPDEKTPPSDKGALSRFMKAGEKLSIQLKPVTSQELRFINQYDGLFIRETTSIDHYTYRIACDAEANGLVVIDDPDSILRCCNKVFLHDAFNYKNVPSLHTRFINECDEETIASIEENFVYPLILKMPEGSFSKGVFKVNNQQELIKTLSDLLKDSALVLAQEYVRTDFDWRIGVLNGRALYACRYHMAKNHWQIYNHDSKKHFSGRFDTLATFEAPKRVLDAALKAAAVVGNGLYGIDIKEVDNRAYVLEVNDNPNIDHGVEDVYLGDELYMQIMSEFLRRLELRGK